MNRNVPVVPFSLESNLQINFYSLQIIVALVVALEAADNPTHSSRHPHSGQHVRQTDLVLKSLHKRRIHGNGVDANPLMGAFRSSGRRHHPKRRDEPISFEEGAAIDRYSTSDDSSAPDVYPQTRDKTFSPVNSKMLDAIFFGEDFKGQREPAAAQDQAKVSANCRQGGTQTTRIAGGSPDKKSSWIPQIDPSVCHSSDYCDDVTDYPA